MILLFINRVAPKNALLSSGRRTAAWVSLSKIPGGGGRAISERRAARRHSRVPPSARVRTRGENTCPCLQQAIDDDPVWSTKRTGRDERGLSQETSLCAERKRHACESLLDVTSHSGL